MSQDTRPFVFSFVLVHCTREVLGARETWSDEVCQEMMRVLDSQHRHNQTPFVFATSNIRAQAGQKKSEYSQK